MSNLETKNHESTPELKLKSLTIELYNSKPNRDPLVIIDEMTSILATERSKHSGLVDNLILDGASGVAVIDDDGEID